MDEGLEIGVQRGNLGASQKGNLLFQMAHELFIIRLIRLLQGVRQGSGNTGLHLAGGGFGKGENQKLIHIDMVFRILHQPGNPLRQNRRFPAAGCSGKKKISPLHRKGLFLFFCPMITHSISPFSEVGSGLVYSCAGVLVG